MTRQKLIVGGVLGLVVIAVLVGLFVKGRGGLSVAEQVVSTSDPANTVLDFYDPWLTAVQATSTDPYQAGLADAPILSPELRTRLADAREQSEGGLDPVLCQTKVPEQISARPVYQNDAGAQLLVRSSEKGWSEQAVVTLVRHNDGWYIADISCSSGESAPEREFSFEREGYLLKSVVAPLDPRYWHLVFEEGGQQGHVAPLFFDAESMCITTAGTESVCLPDQFVEPSKAFVRGQLSESGVEVKRLELREDAD